MPDKNAQIYLWYCSSTVGEKGLDRPRTPPDLPFWKCPCSRSRHSAVSTTAVLLKERTCPVADFPIGIFTASREPASSGRCQVNSNTQPGGFLWAYWRSALAKTCIPRTYRRSLLDDLHISGKIYMV